MQRRLSLSFNSVIAEPGNTSSSIRCHHTLPPHVATIIICTRMHFADQCCVVATLCLHRRRLHVSEMVGVYDTTIQRYHGPAGHLFFCSLILSEGIGVCPAALSLLSSSFLKFCAAAMQRTHATVHAHSANIDRAAATVGRRVACTVVLALETVRKEKKGAKRRTRRRRRRRRKGEEERVTTQCPQSGRTSWRRAIFPETPRANPVT